MRPVSNTTRVQVGDHRRQLAIEQRLADALQHGAPQVRELCDQRLEFVE